MAKAKAKAPPKTRGRKAYKPTDEMRKKIVVMVTAGLAERTISTITGLARMTLRKYYPDELSTGRETALFHNTTRLIILANKGNVAAAIYLQKCLGGQQWREYRHDDVSGDVKINVVYGESASRTGKKK